MMYLEQIQKTVSKECKGKLFSYSDIQRKLSQRKISASRSTILRALKRLKQKKQIKLVQGRKKGLYYVPQKGRLGLLKPKDEEIIKVFLKNKKSYISGVSLYNKWNLTTQIPRVITIAVSSNRYWKRDKLFNVRIKLVSSRAPISDTNIKLLQYLDALDVKAIPDFYSESISILRKNIRKLDVKELMKIAKNYYPPRVRALLGAIIELEFRAKDISAFKKNITSSGSVYKIPINPSDLPNWKSWNILCQ